MTVARSMPYQDFLLEISRMTSVYGDKAYPAERIASIWRVCSLLPTLRFRQVITNLIDENQYPPMVPIFKAAIRPHLDQIYAAKAAQLREGMSLEGSCEWCDLRGILFAQRKEMPGIDTVFRCPFCKAAEVLQLSSRIAMWESRWLSMYCPKYSDGVLSDPSDVADPRPSPPFDSTQFTIPVEQVLMAVEQAMPKDMPPEQQIFDI